MRRMLGSRPRRGIMKVSIFWFILLFLLLQFSPLGLRHHNSKVVAISTLTGTKSFSFKSNYVETPSQNLDTICKSSWTCLKNPELTSENNKSLSA